MSVRFQEALFRPRPQVTEDDVRETESLDGDELQELPDSGEHLQHPPRTIRVQYASRFPLEARALCPVPVK